MTQKLKAQVRDLKARVRYIESMSHGSYQLRNLCDHDFEVDCSFCLLRRAADLRVRNWDVSAMSEAQVVALERKYSAPDDYEPEPPEEGE